MTTQLELPERARARTGQVQWLKNYFEMCPNMDISAVDLHKAASPSGTGYCGSLSRRISDLRKLGMNIIKSRDEFVNGQRHTWYRFIL